MNGIVSHVVLGWASTGIYAPLFSGGVRPTSELAGHDTSENLTCLKQVI